MEEKETRQSLLTDNVQDPQPLATQEKQKPSPKKRLDSLDVHRGLTMAGMILVDCSGQSPPWVLDHVQWNGLSTADLIFPSFVFIMGMAVPLAMSANRPFKRKNFIRIIALFLIGMILNLLDCAFDFSEWRILGVLQRLSVCYGLISLIHVITQYGQRNMRVFGSLITVCVGLIYISLMVSFENKDIGCNKENNLSPFCNFGSYIDRKVFGQKHLYEGGPNDPEGLFTNLSAYLNAFIGYYFCLIMSDNKGQIRKILMLWSLFSLILLVTVYPLTFLMPINKKIWSISFVFVSCGIAGLCLTFLTYTIDVIGVGDNQYSRIVKEVSKPFIYLGRNPLAVYVLMMATENIVANIPVTDDGLWDAIYYSCFESWIPGKEVASTIYGLFWLVIWILVGWIMFKKNIFIRL